MKKLSVLFLAIVIASAGMGVSYAAFSTIGTALYTTTLAGEPDVAFLGDLNVYDNETEKDVGTINAWPVTMPGSGVYKSIQVEIYGAYPCYAGFIDFIVKNTGARPINVNGIVAEDYDRSAMSITVIGNFSQITWLDVDEEVEGTCVITVLNGALEDTTYDFEIGLGFDEIV